MKQCFEHYRTLRKEMDAWLGQSRSMDPPSRHGGGEDEANYSLAWFPHYLITGNDRVREHFEHLRDMLAGWVERDCLHGYEPEAEAHHGTEPFLLFLPRYLGLFPGDEKANALLQDAAEHIGNWVPGIPEWFDWGRNRFYGYYIGTRTVGRDDGYDAEIAEHFRFVHIALAAHRMTGQDRYLDWALQYGKRRAEMIVAIPDGPLPIAWDANGQPRFGKQATGQQKKAAQAGHHVPGDPLIGVEVLLASGVIYALGRSIRSIGGRCISPGSAAHCRTDGQRIVGPVFGPRRGGNFPFSAAILRSLPGRGNLGANRAFPRHARRRIGHGLSTSAPPRLARRGQAQRHDLLGNMEWRWLCNTHNRTEHSGTNAGLSGDG